MIAELNERRAADELAPCDARYRLRYVVRDNQVTQFGWGVGGQHGTRVATYC